MFNGEKQNHDLKNAWKRKIVRLFEGQMVRFLAPKMRSSEYMVFEKNAPIYCTAKEHFSFSRTWRGIGFGWD